MTWTHLHDLHILQVYEMTHAFLPDPHMMSLHCILATLLHTDLQLYTDLKSVAKATLKDNLFSHKKDKLSSKSITPFQTIMIFSLTQTCKNLYLDIILIFTMGL